MDTKADGPKNSMRESGAAKRLCEDGTIKWIRSVQKYKWGQAHKRAIRKLADEKAHDKISDATNTPVAS